MSLELAAEVRNWLAFIFAVVGGTTPLLTYIASQKQRRLENSFRIVNLFNNLLQEDDLKAWKEIFRASSEPAGINKGTLCRLLMVNAK